MKTEIKPMLKRAIPATCEYSLILDDEQCSELHRIISALLDAINMEIIVLNESQIDFIANIQTELETRDLNQ